MQNCLTAVLKASGARLAQAKSGSRKGVACVLRQKSMQDK